MHPSNADGLIPPNSHSLTPQLVTKYALPAALSIANDTKGGAEVKQAANQLLAALGRNMGQALVDHALTLPAALQQRVLDVI